MPVRRAFLRLSLAAKLLISYCAILLMGGLATSTVGSWLVSSTIKRQVRSMVDRDLATATMVYQEQLEALKQTVRVAGAGTTVEHCLASRDMDALHRFLEPLRKDANADFLAFADADGRVVMRAGRPSAGGDDVSALFAVREALRGEVVAGTVVLDTARLAAEDPSLRERAVEEAGLVLMAGAPVRGEGGAVAGALYAGILLNQNVAIVDRVFGLTHASSRAQGAGPGMVALYQRDIPIVTNVVAATGERAPAPAVSGEVRAAVLDRGETFGDSANVGDDWYMAAWKPIADPDGRAVGILFVGTNEAAYTTVRNTVILSFFGIATVGLVLILVLTYSMIRSITRPVREMVGATRRITKGDFDIEIPSSSAGEIGLLTHSFNVMLASLRQMKEELLEWARTLEEKVQDRTEELAQMQTQVARSDRLASLGRLAAGVAHEINNPLGGILTLTGLTLEDLPPDHPCREDLEEVIRQTMRCRDIVKGLLEFSRQSEANREPSDVNAILRDTLSLIEKQALFHNIEVVRNQDPDLPSVLADRSQLQQVFMNVIMNAVQAMDEKGTITISTRVDEGGEMVEIAISDTGHGVPPELQDRIFDPFYTTKDSGKGTGLGLSIAYGIVSKHHGTITVESAVGEWSTFTIRIPLASGSERCAG